MKRIMMFAVLGISMLTTACGSEEEPLYTVNTREMSAVVEENGVLRQTGRYEIEFPDRAPHRLELEVLQNVVKGEEDIALNVNDTDAGVNSAYVLSDENSSASIDAGAGAVDVVVNPDETITVDGTQFATAEEAGGAVADHPKLASNTPESLATADDQLAQMEEIDDGTDKGGKKARKIVKAVVREAAKYAVKKVVCIKTGLCL